MMSASRAAFARAALPFARDAPPESEETGSGPCAAGTPSSQSFLPRVSSRNVVCICGLIHEKRFWSN